MSDIAIRVQGLSKRYRIGQREPYRALRDVLARGLTAPFRATASVFRRSGPNGNGIRDENYIWALKDVSFEVKRGEVVGIIGRNGAGKSTLLKILSRITEPTEGYAEIHGRVGSLLEVGTGFHPELTGRENIYLNGAILGMKKKEIDRKFDEIVAFAEVEKFIDTPVKHYSSGMYVRLAFAVAAHLEPEILLVDEVLAVGDAAFQKKCLGKMGDVAKEGRTVLFVSHNMAAVEHLCGKALLMEKGKIIEQSDSQSVINYYLAKVLPSAIGKVPLSERTDRSGNGRIRLTSFHVEDHKGNRLEVVRSGMDLVFVFGFRCQEGQIPTNVDIGFSLHSDKDQMLFVLYSSYVGQTFETVPSEGAFRCYVPHFPISRGRYRIGARVTVNGEEADWPQDGVGYLDVEDGDFYGTGRKGFEGNTPFLVSGKWDVKRANGKGTKGV
ncbi:lipopolysaccharide transport system ATP-binding protein [Thermodesulfitimonas autotrophica]|uniref:Lipopolysaccharide transport system ATP-binding protein n=1 Tax=Thermodesulfitimonas autotrophica TaxID=1894989 RepID=A0A3N5BTA9_9THEO|nr:ABC transporter ATP-binding protein [Thermodesulfitimonas autotrophica]RPF47021.1 lipopolysaccharide transport system ATP-binding protein [Thermodesulfitimonas autotrophica]